MLQKDICQNDVGKNKGKDNICMQMWVVDESKTDMDYDCCTCFAALGL